MEGKMARENIIRLCNYRTPICEKLATQWTKYRAPVLGQGRENMFLGQKIELYNMPNTSKESHGWKPRKSAIRHIFSAIKTLAPS